MKIYIGADHAGFELKETLKKFLTGLGHQVKDFGANKYDPEDDYPDFVIPAAQAVAEGSEKNRGTTQEVRGIIIGFGGQGEAIAANRVKGVRAIVYYGEPVAVSEVGRKRGDKLKNALVLSREDNDANVLALAAGFVSEEEAKKAAELWLNAPFSGVARHKRRIEKIDKF
ncbi:MAG: RpiB/LacA/LacB family sugar-phosphate isomerase [bacterium]|nr:RpiB/LacA/LacB family sugar-phosphate isomerase [bacterium]